MGRWFGRYIRITHDQWEGLQAELSWLKSQVAELQAELQRDATGYDDYEYDDDEDDDGDELTLQSILDDLKRRDDMASGIRTVSETSDPEDWGLDMSWRVRIPVMVTLVDGPPGLELGPFVLTTPEERDIFNRSWDMYSDLAEAHLDQIEELERRIDALAKRNARQANLLAKAEGVVLVD